LVHHLVILRFGLELELQMIQRINRIFAKHLLRQVLLFCHVTSRRRLTFPPCCIQAAERACTEV
jgi:hypothetical protein